MTTISLLPMRSRAEQKESLAGYDWLGQSPDYGEPEGAWKTDCCSASNLRLCRCRSAYLSQVTASPYARRIGNRSRVRLFTFHDARRHHSEGSSLHVV